MLIAPYSRVQKRSQLPVRDYVLLALYVYWEPRDADADSSRVGSAGRGGVGVPWYKCCSLAPDFLRVCLRE